MKNKIKRAMDAHLSCLHATDASRAAILSRVQGGIKVKKKLSLGLILALTLTLIVIGALAAVLLTHKEFVDQVLSPKASENASESWTQEEMNQILRIARENGVSLDEEALAWISGKDVNYKEEIMRLFAKAELGFYPSTWSIEDQAWYDQVLVDSGLSDQRMRFVPEGDEIPQQKALEIVHAYIRDNFDVNAAVTDTALYRRHIVYQSYYDNPYSKGRQWVIEYEPLDHAHSYYSFILLSDGTVKDARREPGPLEEGGPGPTPIEVQDMYQQDYGVPSGWSMETWISFQSALAESAKRNEYSQSSAVGSILRQKYALPEDTSIPREAAIDAARPAIAAAGGPDEKALAENHLAYGVYLISDQGPVWKISFFCQAHGCGLTRAHMAEVDARTGQVLRTEENKRTDPWHIPYVLSGTLLETPPPAPTSTPRADGKPRIWYSGIAPAYYWEALDKLAYTSEDASDLMDRWHSEYGWDNRFWPLAQRAVDIIWHELGEGATVLPGLPAPEDMQQEEALDMAWRSLRQVKAQSYDAALMDGLKTLVSFTFNTPNMGDRVWNIEFAQVTPAEIKILEHAAINAITGEILGSSWGAGPTPAPSATPRPDGKPVLWHSDLAPDYFWQMLEAMDDIGHSAEEYRQQCTEKYGKDQDFWPLAEKAVLNLWYSDPGASSILSGLPAPSDMQQEEAVALALKTLLDAYGSSLGEEYFKDLKTSVSFHFNAPGMGDRTWFIQFVEVTPDENIYCASVSINAETGVILNMTAGKSHG